MGYAVHGEKRWRRESTTTEPAVKQPGKVKKKKEPENE